MPPRTLSHLSTVLYRVALLALLAVIAFRRPEPVRVQVETMPEVKVGHLPVVINQPMGVGAR